MYWLVTSLWSTLQRFSTNQEWQPNNFGSSIRCKIHFWAPFQVAVKVSSILHKLGMLRKAHRMFGVRLMFSSCFCSLIFPLLKYCAPLWSSSATCHLHFDRVVQTASFSLWWFSLGDSNLHHDVSCVCMLYNIRCNPFHPLHHSVPGLYLPAREGCLILRLHSVYLQPILCHTSQFSIVSCPLRQSGHMERKLLH